MSSSNDLIVHYIAVVIAVIIVLIGWMVIAGVSTFVIRRWTRSQLAKLPEGHEDDGGALRWILAIISFLFWPAAIILGIFFLSKPETARTGAWCLYALLLYGTGSVLLAEAIVVGVAVIRPDVLMLL